MFDFTYTSSGYLDFKNKMVKALSGLTFEQYKKEWAHLSLQQIENKTTLQIKNMIEASIYRNAADKLSKQLVGLLKTMGIFEERLETIEENTNHAFLHQLPSHRLTYHFRLVKLGFKLNTNTPISTLDLIDLYKKEDLRILNTYRAEVGLEELMENKLDYSILETWLTKLIK